MRAYRDFTKPFHCEIIANKKAIKLKRSGMEWDAIRTQLNISSDEMKQIIDNYKQLIDNAKKQIESM
jgi:orotate phosphoribosyltransferase-like protein